MNYHNRTLASEKPWGLQTKIQTRTHTHTRVHIHTACACLHLHTLGSAYTPIHTSIHARAHTGTAHTSTDTACTHSYMHTHTAHPHAGVTQETWWPHPAPPALGSPHPQRASGQHALQSRSCSPCLLPSPPGHCSMPGDKREAAQRFPVFNPGLALHGPHPPPTLSRKLRLCRENAVSSNRAPWGFSDQTPRKGPSCGAQGLC